MATYNAPAMSQSPVTKAGINHVVFPYTCPSVTVGGEVGAIINYGVVPAYSEIIDVKLITEAHEASSTLSVGYTNSDATAATYFLATTAISAAAAPTSISLPYYPTHDTTITGAIGTGTMTATKKSYVVVSYNYIGQP